MHEAEDERKNRGHRERGNAPFARKVFRNEIGDDEESDAEGKTLEEVPQIVGIRIGKIGDAKGESGERSEKSGGEGDAGEVSAKVPEGHDDYGEDEHVDD